MKILLIISLLLCNALAVSAQTKKYRWFTELCEYEGTYDASRYTEKQIEATYQLYFAGDFNLQTDATAQRHEDVGSLSLDALSEEYTTKSNVLRGLDIVKLPYWIKLKERKLKELEQVYNLSRVTIEAYENPARLKAYTPAASCVKTYVDPLIEGGNALLITWRKLDEESRQRNANPERLRRIFEDRYNSPEKLRHAQIQVMRFGWWNCANAFVQRVEQNDTPEKNFKKLFKRVRTISCDEP
ncbi:MAG TPA: hypothetical protein VF599_16095 [Pyrinomonadaceae bacterium]|jgi:hypothetical protein